MCSRASFSEVRNRKGAESSLGNLLMLVLSQESTTRTDQGRGGGFGLKTDFLSEKNRVLSKIELQRLLL